MPAPQHRYVYIRPRQAESPGDMQKTFLAGMVLLLVIAGFTSVFLLREGSERSSGSFTEVKSAHLHHQPPPPKPPPPNRHH